MNKKIQQEMDYAQSIYEIIQNDPRKNVKYRDSRPIINIKHMIETSVEKYSDNIAFYKKDKRNEPYVGVKYSEFLEDMNGIGTGLIDLGLKGKRIAIIGENSYEWAMSYLGVVCGTGIVVPIDKELTIEEIAQFLSDAEVSTLIFSKKYESKFKELSKFEDIMVKNLINMQSEEDSDGILSLHKIMQRGKELIAKGDRSFIDAEIDRDKMSILLFTSGTTGVSKGVMLSHKNIADDLMVAPTVLKVNDWDIFFSVLPLHHTYECTCGFLMPLYKGAAIAYCEGLKYITKNLAEVRPTMFLGVPAIFENLYTKIWRGVRKKGKEKSLKRAIRINNASKKIGVDLSHKLFKDILSIFGGRLRIIISGGAAINPEVLNGFMDFGINAVQGYGLTECAPLAALNPDSAPNSGSIGIEFPGIKLEIRNPNKNGIGEICVNGPNIMLGYYNLPKATAAALEGGVFHTGDLGYKDEKGYVYITGRKKNVIITKNGENVYPEELEYLVNLSPFVSESMVFEYESTLKDDKIIAIAVVVDYEGIAEVYEQRQNEYQVEEIINKVVSDVNDSLPAFKIMKKVIIRKEELKKNTSNKVIRFAKENKL